MLFNEEDEDVNKGWQVFDNKKILNYLEKHLHIYIYKI